MKRNIGVLALQGDFEKHITALNAVGANAKEIRMSEQLNGCDGLIIPGGESTTLTKLMNLYGFYESVKEFSRSYPIMGTCAGLIMLANKVDDDRVQPLKLIDISASRNAYGRQIDSFITFVDFKGFTYPVNAYFIRAPQIINHSEKLNILSEYKGQAIAVGSKSILAMTFHPELGGDNRVHKYFLGNY